MTRSGRLSRTMAALLLGAFASSACGGSTPTAEPIVAPTTVLSQAPTTAAPVTAAPVSPAPATTTPVTEPPATEPPATPEPADEDPADDLEIAAPYSLGPLDERFADAFAESLEDSLGAMSEVFSIGFRSALRGDNLQAFVIVIRFPALPITKKSMLDQLAAGAALATGSTSDTVQVAGESTRIVVIQGQALLFSVLDGDVLAVLGPSRSKTIDVAKAIIEAT